MSSPTIVLRRFALTALLVVVSVLAAVACQPESSLADLDRKLYATSAASFMEWWTQEQAEANGVSASTIRRWLDHDRGRLDSDAARGRSWDVSTDGCSYALDTGAVFDFRRACIRHDFAWRNLRRLDARAGGGIDTRARRVQSSVLFLADMRLDCDRRGSARRRACRAVAQAYYRAVLLVA